MHRVFEVLKADKAFVVRMYLVYERMFVVCVEYEEGIPSFTSAIGPVIHFHPLIYARLTI